MSDVLRQPAEVIYQAELDALKEEDHAKSLRIGN